MSTKIVPSTFSFEQCMLIQLGLKPKAFAVDAPIYPDINVAALRGEVPVGKLQNTNLGGLPINVNLENISTPVSGTTNVAPIVSVIPSNEVELLSDSDDEAEGEDDD
jgi:hypothetical protein